MTLDEMLRAAADSVPLWRSPAVVVLFGLAAVGFLLWWDVMFGDDE